MPGHFACTVWAGAGGQGQLPGKPRWEACHPMPRGKALPHKVPSALLNIFYLSGTLLSFLLALFTSHNCIRTVYTLSTKCSGSSGKRQNYTALRGGQSSATAGGLQELGFTVRKDSPPQPPPPVWLELSATDIWSTVGPFYFTLIQNVLLTCPKTPKARKSH